VLSVRLALAVTLSPIVLAIEFYILRLLGLSFRHVVPVLVILNLGSVLLIIRNFRLFPSKINWKLVSFGSIIYAILAGCVAIPWIYVPNFRRFSWHGLLHTDICYLFARGALIPEDPELAGVSLAYPWFGHIYWAILAFAADLSPTQIYLITNLVILGATGVLYYALARELGASEPVALAAPVIIALGTNVLGLIGWSFIPGNNSALYWAILGDLRTAPFLQKFVTFEIMTYGLSLYVGLIHISVISLKYSSRFELLLAPFVVIAISALYPNLFPAAVMILGGLVIMLLWGERYFKKNYGRDNLGKLILLSVLALIVSVLIIKVYSIDRVSSALALSSFKAFSKKTMAAGFSLIPVVVAMWWLWRSESSNRRAPLLFLVIAFIGALSLNLLIRLNGLNEYKFLYAASICLSAPALVGAERVLLKSNRSRWMLISILLPFLVFVMVSYSIHRIPANEMNNMEINDDSFWLSLSSGNPDSGWIEAIRTDTPENTILVVNHPEYHVTSFVGRSLLVPSEGDKYHFGYNMSSRFDLVNLRGYSKPLFDSRYDLLLNIYSPTLSTKKMNNMLKQLKSFQRPLAIVFGSRDERVFLHWLKTLNVGSELFNDNEERIVYFIP
jgi:hypothetical protein